MTVPDEQAVRDELADVRDRMLRDVAADCLDGRELLGAVGPVVSAVGAAVTVALVSSAPEALAEGDSADVAAFLILLGCGLLLVYGGWWLIRPYVRRRVREVREFRRLRRRELELLAQLPAGTTGPGVYRQYFGRFFGDPAVFGLLVFGLVCMVLVVVVA